MKRQYEELFDRAEGYDRELFMPKARGEENSMDEQQRKSMLKETFDTVSNGYDNKALRFFPDSARHMAALLRLRGDEHVLDVACGTGHASLAIARSLPGGRVTAADFSTGMLDRARQKAASLDVRNVEFVERDMQALGFPDGHFDAAVCAFGIFFVEDMDAQLLHIASKVKPGGRVMITNFEENYFHPLKDLMVKRLEAYGAHMLPQTWKRIASEAGCGELFENAGLTNITVDRKNVGYYLDSAKEWWKWSGTRVSAGWWASFRNRTRSASNESICRRSRR